MLRMSAEAIIVSTSPAVPKRSCMVSYPKIRLNIISMRKEMDNTKVTPTTANPKPIRISLTSLVLSNPFLVKPNKIKRLFSVGL
ncbi:hypothetical protein ES703_05845 [subsurface metagenome]